MQKLKKIIFFLLPASLIIDILTFTVYEAGSYLSNLRGLLYYSFIFYVIFVKVKYIDKLTWFIFFYFLYIIIQIPFSTYPMESLRISSKVLLSILMFPIGYYLINNYERLAMLNRSVVVMMVIYISNFFISQYYDIGFSAYTQGTEFLLGNLGDSWNNVTYMLIVVPLILITEKDKKILVLSLSFILFILLIVGLKRTAIFGLGFGYVIYLILSGKSLKSIIILSGFIILFFITLPNFETILTDRIEARGDRLHGKINEIVSKEGRYLETIAVVEETISLRNPGKVLFGIQAFNSVGNYANGSFGARQLHIDYNLILNTTGVVGLLLYFNIFYLIYKQKRKLIIQHKNNAIFKTLNSVFYMLLLTQFFTSFGGQMYAITFRSIIFIYLGAILSNMKNYQDYHELI